MSWTEICFVQGTQRMNQTPPVSGGMKGWRYQAVYEASSPRRGLALSTAAYFFFRMGIPVLVVSITL